MGPAPQRSSTNAQTVTNTLVPALRLAAKDNTPVYRQNQGRPTPQEWRRTAHTQQPRNGKPVALLSALCDAVGPFRV